MGRGGAQRGEEGRQPPPHDCPKSGLRGDGRHRASNYYSLEVASNYSLVVASNNSLDVASNNSLEVASKQLRLRFEFASGSAKLAPEGRRLRMKHMKAT